MVLFAVELTVLQLSHLQFDFHSGGTWPLFWQFLPALLKFPQPLLTIACVFSPTTCVKLRVVVTFRDVSYTWISRSTALRSEVHGS